MFELIFWGIIIYIFVKGIMLFIRFFIPAVRNPVHNKPQKSPESKYKNAEEIDFIEIKSDKKDDEKQNSSDG
jgi:hypothetical protein